MLLPFTMDPHGGLGYSAHKFLYGNNPKCPYKYSIGPRPQPHTQQLYTLLQSAPKGLLNKATQAAEHNPLTTSYSPTRWAHHMLSLNITTALAKHALSSINILTSPTPPLPADLVYIGIQYPQQALPPAVLNPCPTHMHLGTTS